MHKHTTTAMLKKICKVESARDEYENGIWKTGGGKLRNNLKSLSENWKTEEIWLKNWS